MRVAHAFALSICVLAAAGCVDDAPASSPFVTMEEVTARAACDLGGVTTFANSALDANFPPGAAITERSQVGVGRAPSSIDDEGAVSLGWANTIDGRIHIVAATATGQATLAEAVYHELDVGETDPVLYDLTISPAFGIANTPLYDVNLATSGGFWSCRFTRMGDDSIETNCGRQEQIDDAAEAADVTPIRSLQAVPILNEDDFFTYVTDKYVFLASSGTVGNRIGAVRTSGIDFLNGGFAEIDSFNFPDITTRQDTPFFSKLVLGVSSEANRAPYLLALTQSGGQPARPHILRTNEARTLYETFENDWNIVPGYTPTQNTFSFVSSLDISSDSDNRLGVSINTGESDARFGYVAVRSDGSLTFSRPGGWDDDRFRRWVPSDPITAIWAFENLAWRQTPGDPVIFAATATGKLTVIRWDLDDELEVIPDALAGTGATNVTDAAGSLLVNHDGTVAVTVERDGSPDIAIVRLEAVRDFTDALCD